MRVTHDSRNGVIRYPVSTSSRGKLRAGAIHGPPRGTRYSSNIHRICHRAVQVEVSPCIQHGGCRRGDDGEIRSWTIGNQSDAVSYFLHGQSPSDFHCGHEYHNGSWYLFYRIWHCRDDRLVYLLFASDFGWHFMALSCLYVWVVLTKHWRRVDLRADSGF